MFGLMVLGAVALYLGLMFFVVRWAWRKGRANGGSVLKASAFAGLGFLVVYLPVFWNHIPVLLAHRSMCAKDAGFKVHKTPEQWLTENKSRFGVLRGTDLDAITESRRLSDGSWRTEHFGGLLATESRTSYQTLYGVKTIRTEIQVVDTRGNGSLTTAVNYQVGTLGDLRWWRSGRTCYQQGDMQAPWIQATKFNQQLKEGVK